MKKKTKKQKFPRIYRIITDWRTWVGVISAFLMVGIILVGSNLYQHLNAKRDLQKERERLTHEIKLWQGIIEKYKDYRDGYFSLATLEYRVGNKNEAKKYLEKTLELDPNFKSGRQLENLLLVSF